MFNSRDMQQHVTFCAQAKRLLDRGVAGEMETIRYLYGKLDVKKVGNYRILVNYNFPQRGTNTLEIDVLVITAFGVFLLEVKNWVGTIEAYDDAWFSNGDRRENVFGIASSKARNIHSYLSQALRDTSLRNQKISVVSLIVLVRGTNKFINKSSYEERSTVGLDEELIHLLSSTDILHLGKGNKRLSDREIDLVYKALYRGHQSQVEEIVGDYRLLKKVRSTDLFEEFEAQNIHVHTQTVRLKSYQLHTLANERVTGKTIERFKRDLEVVYSLGHHPHIIWTMHFFPDPKYYDLYYEVTEPINGQRLDEFLQQMSQEGRQMSFEEQIRLLLALCEALRHAHNHKPEPVYHRNISTETVFLIQERDSSQTSIKLADFDFAKYGKHTINPMYLGADYKNKVLIDKVFTAPEVRRDASDARAYSDIYALGVLWGIIASSDTTTLFDPQTNRDKIDTFSIPLEARTLIKQMVADETTNRPQKIEDLIDAIGSLPREKE